MCCTSCIFLSNWLAHNRTIRFGSHLGVALPWRFTAAFLPRFGCAFKAELGSDQLGLCRGVKRCACIFASLHCVFALYYIRPVWWCHHHHGHNAGEREMSGEGGAVTGFTPSYRFETKGQFWTGFMTSAAIQRGFFILPCQLKCK